MKIVISEFVTLDGVMQAPGTQQEGVDVGFDRSGWNLPYMDEEAGQYKYEELLGAEGLLFGAITYKAFAAFWPTAHMGEFSDRLNSLTKYVVAPDLAEDELTWQNTHQIKGNVIEEVRKLREKAGKDLLVWGSGQLVQTLVQHDLVDEYRLMVHPIILGKGKKLFQDGLDQKELVLKDTKVFSTGLIALTYTPTTN